MNGEEENLYPLRTGSPSSVNGRVLRLNFACHAELPHGSTLRVTSSSLWACTAGNTSVHNAAHANAHQYDSYEEGDLDDLASEQHAIYTSSVDMVTSPEEYPIWRTRTPVVCVVNTCTDEGTFKHRYRYLVVTPGAGIHDGPDSEDQDLTNDDDDGFVHVTTWEDPFQLAIHGDNTRVKQRSLDELPYRSIDVNVSSEATISKFGEISISASDSLDTTRHTHDGTRIDFFNESSDNSFSTYKEALEIQRIEKELGSASGDKKKKSEDSLQMGDDTETNKRLFIVCYHLPIKLTRDEVTGEYSASFSESLIAKTEDSGVSKSYPTQWVGTVSIKAEDEMEREKIRQVLKPLDCIPLFLDDHTRQSFYYGMCKQVLWPAFHNIDLLDISKSGWGQQNIFDREGHLADPMECESNWDQSRLDGWWNAFRAVNRTFCDAIMSIIKKNDIVWVHDYHLSLLPKLLHEAEEAIYGKRTIQMVFFLHIPFPTSQVFRELERGEFILEGMLHADVVGFHAFDHARHFLNAAKRILGLSHESLVGGLIGVKYRGTKVLVTISNVSIESDVVAKCLTTNIVQDEAAKYRANYEKRSIIGGIDIAQGLSGLSLKLLAFERLLVDYPNWRDKVTLVQVCLVPFSRKNDEADTLSHVRYLVKRIQNTFGKDMISYHEVTGSSLPIERRLALYLASDVFFTAPIREGLNLLPLEYIFARKDGVMITTEFSTVSSVLNGALRVNPYDIPVTSTCIDTALSMSAEEKASRRQRDIAFVSSSNSGLWTRRVLADLNDVTMSSAKIQDERRKNRPLSNMESVQAVSELHMASQPLDKTAVVKSYRAAESRVIFVDFNGTIVMKEPAGKYLKRDMLGSSGNTPPIETMKALTSLCEDPKNVVYVVSGDTESNIQNAIGNVEGLGLAAGNGGMISHPSRTEKRKKWVASDLGVQWDEVKKIVLPILSKYTARANGSFVKLTSSSIGWSYYSCDPEWGSMLSSHLVEELENQLHAFDVRLVTLKGVIEVVPRKLNKGLVVKNVLRRKRDLPDFIMCIGDDISDEKMFTAVFSIIAQGSAGALTKTNASLTPKHAFTITVGKKVSNASYFVEDAADVAGLLIKLSGNKTNRAMSWDNDDEGLAMFDS